MGLRALQKLSIIIGGWTRVEGGKEKGRMYPTRDLLRRDSYLCYHAFTLSFLPTVACRGGLLR